MRRFFQIVHFRAFSFTTSAACPEHVEGRQIRKDQPHPSIDNGGVARQSALARNIFRATRIGLLRTAKKDFGRAIFRSASASASAPRCAARAPTRNTVSYSAKVRELTLLL